MIEFKNVIFPCQKKTVYGTITCEGRNIVGVEVKQEIEDEAAFEAESGSRSYVIPGLVDTHTHGFRGRNSECGDLEAYLKSYLERGVTAVCPAVGPRPLAEYKELIRRYENAEGGARVPGLHLEGPYLSPVRKGAIDAAAMYEINLEELEDFLRQCSRGIAIMTMAPELAFAAEAASLLAEYGVKISYGHTDASFGEAASCYHKDLCQITHVFNGMRPFNHHEAGILDFILKNRVLCELICDGNHVTRETMEWFIEAMGKDRIHCISDGGESCGYSFPDGYELAPGTVVRHGAVWEQGTLAGSTRDLLDGFHSFIRDFRFPLWKAVGLTSENAADFLRLPCGRIAPGYRADLLVLDREYQITEVYLNGRRER